LAIGAVIGAYYGKDRIQRENTYGKEAKPPTSWNKMTAIGGLAGLVLGGIAATAIVVGGMFLFAPAAIPALAASGSVAGAFAGISSTAAAGMLATSIAAIGAQIGSLVIGLRKGGSIGRKEMEQEYALALRERELEKQRENAVSRSPVQSQEASLGQEKWAAREDQRNQNRDSAPTMSR
jgi:hypothetical protein